MPCTPPVEKHKYEDTIDNGFCHWMSEAEQRFKFAINSRYGASRDPHGEYFPCSSLQQVGFLSLPNIKAQEARPHFFEVSHGLQLKEGSLSIPEVTSLVTKTRALSIIPWSNNHKIQAKSVKPSNKVQGKRVKHPNKALAQAKKVKHPTKTLAQVNQAKHPSNEDPLPLGIGVHHVNNYLPPLQINVPHPNNNDPPPQNVPGHAIHQYRHLPAHWCGFKAFSLRVQEPCPNAHSEDARRCMYCSELPELFECILCRRRFLSEHDAISHRGHYTNGDANMNRL